MKRTAMLVVMVSVTGASVRSYGTMSPTQQDVAVN